MFRAPTVDALVVGERHRGATRVEAGEEARKRSGHQAAPPGVASSEPETVLLVVSI